MTSIPQERPRSTWLGLVAWLVVSMAAGAIGGLASINARPFYAELVKPAWAPPGWLFGPVWTTLYVLMGIAAWLVWRERGRVPVRHALTFFVVQLVANALWTFLFFTFRNGALALAEIVLLALLINATMVLFGRIRRVAAALLVPYLLWVLFATALTARVWRNNPGLL